MKTLASKLCAIMGECKNIPKNGKNSFQNYKYVMAADAAEYIRELMVKHGVIVIPAIEDVQQEVFKTAKGADNYLVRVLIAYTLVNSEDSKDTYTVKMAGTGSDTSDKAIFKAITGSQKYFIFNTFMLGGDDDPEKDDSRPNPQGSYKAVAPKVPQPSPTPRLADNLPPKAISGAWDGNAMIRLNNKNVPWKAIPRDSLEKLRHQENKEISKMAELEVNRREEEEYNTGLTK